MNVPALKEINGKKILTVHGKPFIMIAGEVHNSSSSSPEYMVSVWDKAVSLGMNSLLLPVSWEMIEPEEGVWDFSVVDALIMQARERGMKIGLLWFGSWKNAQCTYAPSWVKTDLERFWRAEVEKGKTKTQLQCFYGMSYSSLSYLCKQTRDADAKAFATLMRHIRQFDGEEHTVITVQVENEVGIMGTARENSDFADQLFSSPAPQGLVDYLRTHTDFMAADVRDAVTKGAASGSWEEVFGDVAEELFSAYHFASYINAVAEAGKAEYPLPMTVNCWLDKGDKPGFYPTGGPVARVMEVWQYAAPMIDVFAPDIYVPYFCDICDAFIKNGNPLVIPETAVHLYAASRLVYAIGHYHALCYSPFGFEEMGLPFTDMQAHLYGMDTSDPALSTPQSPQEYAWYAATLCAMMPLLTKAYGTNHLQAVCYERREQDLMDFGSFHIRAQMEFSGGIHRKDGACLVLNVSENEFYILACGCTVDFLSGDPSKPHIDQLLLEEGEFRDGQWHMLRRLNGDEGGSQSIDVPTLLRVKLFAYGDYEACEVNYGKSVQH